MGTQNSWMAFFVLAVLSFCMTPCQGIREGDECDLEELGSGTKGVYVESSACSWYNETVTSQEPFCRNQWQRNPVTGRRQPVWKCWVCCRISAFKCSEYRKTWQKMLAESCPCGTQSYCCSATNQFEKKGSDCNDGVSPLIVKGEVARIGQFPHAVALGESYEKKKRLIVSFFCGGSLISEKWVLTAAHCFSAKILTVARLGHQNQDKVNVMDPELDYFIDQEDIRFHPGYSPSAASKYNDIALVKLVQISPNFRGVTFSVNAFPACLSQINPRDVAAEGVKPTVIGWGTTSYYGQQSDYLLFADVPLLSERQCSWRIERNSVLKRYYPNLAGNGVMCGFSPEGKDACQGDSGGGYITDLTKSCEYDVAGIVSSGIGCGKVGIYTDVHHFLSWIEENVWPVNEVSADIARGRRSPQGSFVYPGLTKQFSNFLTNGNR